MKDNVYFIAPILLDDSPLWEVTLGPKSKQVTNVHEDKVAGKLSLEDSRSFQNGEGIGEYSHSQIIDFIALNGIRIFDLKGILKEMQGAEWPD